MAKRTRANNSSRRKIRRAKRSNPTSNHPSLKPQNFQRRVLVNLRQEKPGLAFKKIIENVLPEPDERNSKWVYFRTGKKGVISIKNSGEVIKSKHKAVKSATVTEYTPHYDPEPPPRVHHQVVWARNPNYVGPLWKCPNVVVHCDCSRHTFKWEYALWHHGSAQIINGNGKPPVKTNPRMVPATCKHILQVFHRLRMENK